MILKTISGMLKYFKTCSKGYVHADSCTVSVADHVNHISLLGKVLNPLFYPRLMIPINISYWQMRAGRLWNRFFG
ncbi:hypothetical protein ACFL2O_07415, partial [Thermodesulfobacteriota bacterium]